MAVDMLYKAPPPAPVVDHDWLGAYVGFDVGGSGARSTRVPELLRLGGTGPGGNNFSTSTSDGIYGFDVARSGSGVPGFWALRRLRGMLNQCRSTSGHCFLPRSAVTASFEHKIRNLFPAGPELAHAQESTSMIFGICWLGFGQFEEQRLATASRSLRPFQVQRASRNSAWDVRVASTTWSRRPLVDGHPWRRDQTLRRREARNARSRFGPRPPGPLRPGGTRT